MVGCPHGVVYYLKFLLRSESSRDDIDGLLSLKYIPNVVLIAMAHIIAKHALISRREEVQKYEYNQEGILFEPYYGRVADPMLRHSSNLPLYKGAGGLTSSHLAIRVEMKYFF